jgi:hypothetical protein
MRRPNSPHPPTTCQLRIAGETFLSHQIDVNMENRILIIRHPRFGELKFTERDALLMRVVDLQDLSLLQVLEFDAGGGPMTVRGLFNHVKAKNFNRRA